MMPTAAMAPMTPVPTLMMLAALITLIAFIARETRHARKALDALPKRGSTDHSGGPDTGDTEKYEGSRTSRPCGNLSEQTPR
jgi:hypothetical protein